MPGFYFLWFYVNSWIMLGQASRAEKSTPNIFAFFRTSSYSSCVMRSNNAQWFLDIFHRALLAEQNIIRQRLELGYEPLYHGAAFVRGDIICLPFLAFLATVNYQTHVSRRKNRKAAVVCLQDRVCISDNIYPARNILSYVEAAFLCGAFFLRARGQCALYY